MLGGQEAVPFSWSRMVSIRLGGSTEDSCGGSLTVPRGVTVAVGLHNRSDSRSSSRRVDRIYLHPLWNRSSGQSLHDIAILRLSVPLNFIQDAVVFPACVPPANLSPVVPQYPANGSQVVVVGWGKTRLDSDKNSEELR